MNNLSEFIIDGVSSGLSGTYHVTGRCGDVPFRVGEIFDQIDQPAGPSHPVRLTVTRIHAYQRSLEELGQGMTASIDVQGDGVELLRPSAVLVASHVSSDSIDQSAVSEAAKHE